MTALAVLWHLHQPDYRDPRSRVPVMPWVRLHGVRGYRDLAVEVVEDEVAVTVNVVPSLLDQILHYAEGGSDPHLDLTARPADTLDDGEIESIRETFLAGNPVMIELHKSYRRLARRVRSGERLETQVLLDLQLWSTLAWFGATALRDFPVLRELQEKGSDFSEADKSEMLAVQRRILSELPAQLRRLATASKARVSASAYYHPILPLLVDCRHARRCMPWLPDECRFAWPDDARLQLTRGRRRVAEVVGSVPKGLWPSEGSVSPETVELAAEAGYSWLASDDGVLAKSAAEGGRSAGGWDLGSGMRGFFRDHELSDRVGFQYSRRPAAEAVAELLAVAERRARGGVLTVALDGENPWESFPDAGWAFRKRLHEGLRRGSVRAMTLDEAATLPPVGRVHRLHTGSWIQADFGIWIGHPEDRLAWTLLDDARRAVESAPPDRRAAALERLLPAEGSDWMWWFGEEFSTPFAGTFDALFRAHLKAAWEALGEKPPAVLDRPISKHARTPVTQPVSGVSPSLDQPPTWARWAGAGSARFSRGSAMGPGGTHVKGVRFGWSEEGALWLWFELSEPLPAEPPGTSVRVTVGDVVVVAAYEEGPGITTVKPDLPRIARWPGALVVRAPPIATASEVLVELAIERPEGPPTPYPADGALVLPRPNAPTLAYWSA